MPSRRCSLIRSLGGSVLLTFLLVPRTNALAAHKSSDTATRRPKQGDHGSLHLTRGFFTATDSDRDSVALQSTHWVSAAGQVIQGSRSKWTSAPKVIYFKHGPDSLLLDTYFPAGTLGCPGTTSCQYTNWPAAKDFCDSHGECRGIVQKKSDCDSGCYIPAQGTIIYDAAWLATAGSFWERQVVQYLSYDDGRSFSTGFVPGTRSCQGVHKCQFLTLADAEAFCDPEPTCLGVHQHSESHNGTNCDSGFGCYAPMTGNLARDPLWLSRGGVTYEKMQQVAYMLANAGSAYDQRFDVGTQGCLGEHHCQFLTLEAAEAFCDTLPPCKGVMEHPPTDVNCGGGHGCFLPAKGNFVYDQLWLVTEGKTYMRQFVR